MKKLSMMSVPGIGSMLVIIGLFGYAGVLCANTKPVDYSIRFQQNHLQKNEADLLLSDNQSNPEVMLLLLGQLMTRCGITINYCCSSEQELLHIKCMLKHMYNGIQAKLDMLNDKLDVLNDKVNTILAVIE